MTRAQAHLMLAECDLLDALEANEKKEKNNYTKKNVPLDGGGFQMPPRSQDMMLPAPDRNRIWYMSGKDRANNRSKTPLGFARAVYEVNQGKATEE